MPSKRSFAAASVCLFASSLAWGQDPRADVVKKGSLLIYPAVEVEWNASGQVVLDTIVSIANDYFNDVQVHLYYINGDAPRAAIMAGNPPVIVVEGEPGWNNADCRLTLTKNQAISWSLARGSPTGCQPFSVIDANGRPDPDGDTSRRALRGFVLAWAVDSSDREIQWNHLTGGVTTIDYEQPAAWEFGAYAFQANSSVHGEQTDDRPGQLILNGREYDAPYDVLLLSFIASGATRNAGNGTFVTADTDLTLHLIEADLRDQAFDPVTTSVRYDIWNENEHSFSGTDHMVTCWHQRLLSDLTPPNNFLRTSLQTDQGKVRINGEPRRDCTPRILPAALLGVARTKLAFSGARPGNESTSETLIGQGCEEAAILYDLSGGSPPSARPPRHKPEMDRLRDRVSQKGSDRGTDKKD